MKHQWSLSIRLQEAIGWTCDYREAEQTPDRYAHWSISGGTIPEQAGIRFESGSYHGTRLGQDRCAGFGGNPNPCCQFSTLGEYWTAGHEKASSATLQAPRVNYWQLGNLKLAMRVLQSKVPLVFWYSVVYQNVQSSTGSTVMAL